MKESEENDKNKKCDWIGIIALILTLIGLIIAYLDFLFGDNVAGRLIQLIKNKNDAVTSTLTVSETEKSEEIESNCSESAHESIKILIEDKKDVETYYQLEGTTKTVFGPDLSLIPETSSESIEKTRTNSRYGKIATVSGDYKTIYTDTFNGENHEEYATIDHVDLLEGIETIEEKAFYKCGKLQSISLPKSIKLIADNAFVECDNLTLIVYENSYAYDYCVENDLEYELAQ